MIEVKNIHKVFNRGKINELHVLKGIDLSLPEKGLVAIFGRSGCGKTTLLNVLGGLDSFASGEITLDGESIRHRTDVLRNKYVGYIFQNYNLQKSETCFDNVADALRLCGMTDAGEIEKRVAAALANVDMAHYAARTPDTLSGGQQQRIAIARAIVKNPRIILADEPTGNLDEANTVMIMNLLKQISKDHLVLLVTHEAKLVDYYCDRVIELQDGAVAGERTNAEASGLAARNKNHIYLGELEKHESADAATDISYYGEMPAEPIRLSVVNNGGKFYLRVDTPGIQLIDDTAETRLVEGVFHEKTATVEENIDMSALPPVEGSRFGRLFSFMGSLKSGYAANFKGGKKGKKALRRCMSLFAAALVFMTAVFGTGIGQLQDAQNAYNHNVFYLYTKDSAVSHRLHAALADPASGIDYLALKSGYTRGDERISFHIGAFETFDSYTDIVTTAVPLGASLAAGLTTVAGKNAPDRDEIIITTKVANALLESAMVDYLTDYADLLGLYTTGFSGMYMSGGLRLAGVVDSDETAVYVNELVYAEQILQRVYFPNYEVVLAQDLDISVEPGKTIVAYHPEKLEASGMKKGDKVTLSGLELTISDFLFSTHNYDEWLYYNGIKKQTIEEYLDLKNKPADYDLSMDPAYFTYCDYYFAEADAFLDDLALSRRDIDLWLWQVKGIEKAKYYLLNYSNTPAETYYAAKLYQRTYGQYPSLYQLGVITEDLLNLKEEYIRYEQEYYSSDYNQNSGWTVDQPTYYISESDYIALSKRVPDLTISGVETKPSDDWENEGSGTEKPDIPADGTEKLSTVVTDVMVDNYYYTGEIYYTVIHSNDPEKTAAYLAEQFGDISSPVGFSLPALITPSSLFEEIMTDIEDGITVSLIAMGVILLLMSLCMYFIMRSSLMNRIKEVGIYRAIGVSKKNLIFKFFVETLVLTSLTVLIGFLLSSTFIAVCIGLSPLVSEVFFYPVWLAMIILAILCGLSLLCGILPIFSLLRRSPSTILAKYDI